MHILNTHIHKERVEVKCISKLGDGVSLFQCIQSRQRSIVLHISANIQDTHTQHIHIVTALDEKALPDVVSEAS